MMVHVYSACLPPKPRSFYKRCLGYAKRQLRWSPPAAPVVTDVSSTTAMKHRPVPISVNIVLGNECNLRCIHCGYHNPTAPAYFSSPDRMKPETIQRILHDLPANAKFGAYDEPLLYPSFLPFVKSLIASGRGVHLTTNGTLITPLHLPILKRLKTIYVSIDAASEDTYKAIRGGDYTRTIQNTLDLAKEFEGYQIGVSFIRQPAALHEEQAFIEFWLDKVDMVILYAFLQFNETGYTIDQPFLGNPPSRVVCSSPWLETYIMPNGDVSLCCQTLVMTGRREIPIMGNIHRESLSAIWNGPKYERYRAALVEQDWDHAQICRDCPIWSSSYHKIERKGDLKITRNPTTTVIERIKS